MLACLLSPGPFTTQPMTATFMLLDAGVALAPDGHLLAQVAPGCPGPGAGRRSLVVRPQPGQAVTMGAKERRPMVWRISWATMHLAGAVAAGLGGERDADGVADALLQQHRQGRGGGDDALGAHAGLGQTQVQGIVAACGEQPVDGDQVLHPAHLAGQDDVVPGQAELLRAPRRWRRRTPPWPRASPRRRPGRRGSGVLVHQADDQILVQAAPVDADAHRPVVAAGDLDHGGELAVALLAAPDVAGVDAVLGQGLGALRVVRRAAGGR